MPGFLTDLRGRAPATAGGVAVWPEAAVAPAAPNPFSRNDRICASSSTTAIGSSDGE